MTVSQFKHVCGFDGDFQLYMKVDDRGPQPTDANELQMVFVGEFIGEMAERLPDDAISVARKQLPTDAAGRQWEYLDYKNDETFDCHTFEVAYADAKLLAEERWGDGR